jgi:N-formylglutamate amidohydrolase
MIDKIWDIELGEGPLVATAIHHGAAVREDVRRCMLLDEAVRRREEDPFTAEWTCLAPVRIIGTRSRFEVDLNRPREKAVYRGPEDCWGLHLWSDRLPDDVAGTSLMEYDAFYAMLEDVYGELEKRYGRFVVFDLHTYNHRRDGPDGPVAHESLNPQVNVGTGTMRNRSRWARVIERFMRDLGSFNFPGGKLDVRENVKFRGGEHPRWAHDTFPDSACVLAIEVKKFFMDEWTGQANSVLVDAVRGALASTVTGVAQELGKL